MADKSFGLRQLNLVGGTPSIESSTDLVVNTNGSERFRVDSSGRLLVGTTDGTGTQLLKVNGTTGGSLNGGAISLTQGRTAPPNGSTHGVINFGSETRPNGAAYIVSSAEGAWTDGSSHPSNLQFATTASGSTTPTERIRIRNNGASNFFAANDTVAAHTSASAGTSFVNFAGYHGATNTNDGTNNFLVYSNGNVVNTNNSYGSLSDVKLKENIVDAGSQWNDLKALQVRNYNFKEATGQPTHTQLGVVAQEVELISPGLVAEAPDRDEDGNDLGTTTKSVNYSVLYMKSVKALQEAMERIETLETEKAEILARLDAAGI